MTITTITPSVSHPLLPEKRSNPRSNPTVSLLTAPFAAIWQVCKLIFNIILYPLKLIARSFATSSPPLSAPALAPTFLNQVEEYCKKTSLATLGAAALASFYLYKNFTAKLPNEPSAGFSPATALTLGGLGLIAIYFARNGSLAPSDNTKTAQTILAWYEGGINDRGVKFSEILEKDDDFLEDDHNFIQWLFPLLEKGVNPTAPLTNTETTTAFKTDPKLQEKLQKAFERMLAFYGFSFDSTTGKIEKAHNFSTQAKNWLTPNNHNYRRITRILRSMKLHGQEELAKAFQAAVLSVGQQFPSEVGGAQNRWKAALN